MRLVSLPAVGEIDPGLLGRCGWEVDQARRDVEVLAWLGRFRFVTPKALSERFGVSWQQANARVRRLEKLGLLGSERRHVSEPRAVFLTGKGHELLGWERRRAPRAETQRSHEAAIVQLVTALEHRSAPATRVLTERECRRSEAADAGRYSVELRGGDAAGRSRWPDVVVETATSRRAIEIEFAPKGTRRLQRIVEGYESSTAYDVVAFLVQSKFVGRRIETLVGRPRPLDAFVAVRRTEVIVAPWRAPGGADEAVLARLLAD